jgi:hypothetical protein
MKTIEQVLLYGKAEIKRVKNQITGNYLLGDEVDEAQTVVDTLESLIEWIEKPNEEVLVLCGACDGCGEVLIIRADDGKQDTQSCAACEGLGEVVKTDE